MMKDKSMEGRSSIVNKLVLIQRRLYHDQLIYNCTCYGACGLTMIGILLMVNRFIHLPVNLLIVLIVLLTGVLIVIVSRKLDLLQIARIADDRLKLKDRLSTAVGITRKKDHLDFDAAQLRDAANEAEKIVLSSDFPLKVPALWKLIPIPIILICLSFLITERHNQPELPTAVERQAIDQTVNQLENLIGFADESQLKAEIQETIKKLKGEQITSQQAQASLSQLRDQAHRQKQKIKTDQLKETQKAIYEVTNMPMGDLAANFDKLADQFDGLDAEQVNELKRKLQQIARALGENHMIGNVKNEFSDLQSEVVSAEKLKRMAEALLDLDRQLQHLTAIEETLSQIRESRKRIALAGIEMNQSSSSIADGSGNPGQESGTSDVQGVITQGDNSTWIPNKQNSAAMQDMSMQTQLDGDSILPNNANGIDLNLNNISSDRQGLSQVFVSQNSDSSIEPEYVSFRQAHLNAKQNYAEAIRRDRIPVRYQQQISDYLDAIALIDGP
ncbi:TPA: hypothetical protein EYO57_07685 [Candidatus Poribacteria bacterium]|nr:hypothetical protein [Candidatus Poribacteria bacterium]HIC01800.1 hypothetical protein [Candidatus Poribacteria bacterium]